MFHRRRRDKYEHQKIKYYCEIEEGGSFEKNVTRENTRSLTMNDLDGEAFDDNDDFGGVSDDDFLSASCDEESIDGSSDAASDDGDDSDDAPAGASPAPPSKKRAGHGPSAPGKRNKGSEGEGKRSRRGELEEELPLEDLSVSYTYVAPTHHFPMQQA